jgi:hypothetical protein
MKLSSRSPECLLDQAELNLPVGKRCIAGNVVKIYCVSPGHNKAPEFSKRQQRQE